MNPLRFFLCCTIFVVTHAFADAPRSVDAELFDVAGVKAGMSQAESVSAITKKLQVDERSIQFETSPQLNEVTNTKEPKYFSVKAGLSSVIVHFEPNVPYDKDKPMVVTMVIYEQPWTPDNVSSMKNAALEKYGRPSNGTIGVSWEWCLHPNNNQGLGCFEYRDKGTVLELSQTKLQLTDMRYTNARIEFMRKKQEAKPTF